MKKQCRIVIYSLLLIMFAFSFLFCVSASAEKDVVVNLQIDNPMMLVNGTSLEIDAGRGTKPVVVEGRTLVPIRAIIEAFDGVVGWEEETQSVLLTMEEDNIRLIIDSNVAFLNNEARVLDVAPTVINGRTMLPIRFVAEGFNLGVAWDGKTQTVSVIRDLFDEAEYNRLKSILPEYSGTAYTMLNGNKPFFESYEIVSGSFEYYSTLDDLGRCDVCQASVARDTMPQEERESIGSITPTGWINASYDVVSGGYLYNRCHLIGYQLTGENANERNLITGTRYLNVEGMLPFENQIADYVEKTGNHVMYRSTPVFDGNNLVADGVLLEAYSVEDFGAGLSFCVYCYNVQPLIQIDYATGMSAKEGKDAPPQEEKRVYRTPSGKRYHYDAECGGKNAYEVTLEVAKNAGLTPCSKCAE